MNANAAISAAMNIREKLLEAASLVTGVSSDKLVIGDRRIYDKRDPTIGISYLEALHKAQEEKGALVSSGAYRTPPMGRVHKGAGAGIAPAYSFSAYVAEVKVDAETGQTKVVKIWAAHDCGKALNPLSVKGQMIGSCHMGLGQVLSEEMKYGRNGHLMNPDLLDYKIPSVHEMPEVVPIIVESNDSEGPFGAKEAGEGPLLPILPAVCNAVYDAIGIRTSELPITPDRMYRLIERRCKEESVEPSELQSPRLEHSELQGVLESRAAKHSARDSARASMEDDSPYHNGALFGFDPVIPADEQNERWVVSVTPSEEYVDSPRLAGSAWKHAERRHGGGF
tara:strand:+ start:144 stop:1157 length:1014 start_codon:yes stop_codon:yes gene_type:complete